MSFFEKVTNAAYSSLLGRLSPRGKAWTFTRAQTGLRLFFDAMGEELARAHNRLIDLIDESDPRTTTELIDGWERNLGLPDSCDPSPPTTLADRRAAAHAKLIARGGSQPGILYDVIEAAGYDSTEIQLGAMFRADESAVDERLYDDEAWAFVWFVWRATTPSQGWERLQCLLDRIKPSHTIVNLIDGLRANEVTYPT
jgi:uncharacterized protein YmfQ (DUF2313 family)